MTNFYLFLFLLQIIKNDESDFFDEDNYLQEYNPIIIKKSDDDNFLKLKNDDFLIFSKNINFLKISNLIFSQKFQKLKFENFSKKEKNFLEQKNYKELIYNEFLTNLKKKKNCNKKFFFL